MRMPRKIIEEKLGHVRSITGRHALRLDHAPIYGGYCVVEVDEETGGEREFITSRRMSGQEIVSLLNAYLYGWSDHAKARA